MFLIFGGDNKDGGGGATDLVGVAPTLENAQLLAADLIGRTANKKYGQIVIEWAHIFNPYTFQIVARFGANSFMPADLVQSVEGLPQAPILH